MQNKNPVGLGLSFATVVDRSLPCDTFCTAETTKLRAGLRSEALVGSVVAARMCLCMRKAGRAGVGFRSGGVSPTSSNPTF